MRFFYTLMIVTVTLLLASACSRQSQADTETQPEKPDSEVPYPDQNTLDQDIQEIPSGEHHDEESTPGGEDTAEPQPAPGINHTLSHRPITLPDDFIPAATYTGTLPCADCGGIETELTLFTGPTGQQQYILKRTYITTRDGDKSSWVSGPWEIGQNTAGEKLYRLSYNDEVHKHSFLIVTDRVIRMMDRDENTIKSQHNYSLYRLPD